MFSLSIKALLNSFKQNNISLKQSGTHDPNTLIASTPTLGRNFNQGYSCGGRQ